MTKAATLTEGPIGPALWRLGAPMALGMAAIVLFNVVDTFYVGQLGPEPLAAIGYTFPVVFVVMSVNMGLGIGTTAVVSRAIGEGNRAQVRRLTTHALALGVLVLLVVSAIGLLTIDPVFRALGASDDELSRIRDYMVPWFSGVGLLIVPMLGNAAIRATGDTRTPSVVMVTSGLVNVILDPLLIFGIGPFPRLELFGAAVATVLSWVVTIVASLWILARRERMLDFAIPRLALVLDSWKRILHIGLPAAGTNALMPLTTGVLTRLVSGYGPEAVAAFGVGGRLQGMAMIGISALASGLTPFVGQNFGAGHGPRLRRALSLSIQWSLAWGAVVALVLWLCAYPLGRVFNADPEVIATIVRYLSLIPIGYGAMGILLIATTFFNATGRPLGSAVLIFVRLALLTIPLAWLGAHFFQLEGLFAGMSLANFLAGALAWWMARRLCVPTPERATASALE